MAVRLLNSIQKFFERPFLASVIICILIFYTGFIKIPERNPGRFLLSKEYIERIEGMIISSPVKTQTGKYYHSKLILNKSGGCFNGSQFSSCATGTVSILIPTEMTEAFFPGKLYSAASGKGAFVFESGGNYIFRGNFLNSEEDVFLVKTCEDCRWSDGVLGNIDYFRALCRLQFKRLMFTWKSAGGLLLALLCGSREYLDSAVYSNFRTAGLSHIIALSGMHLSMFSAIALFFGKRFGRKKLTFIIRIISLILFVWFAGFSPSLMRAFICSMLMLFAAVTGVKNPDMLLILCFSFILQCIISPSDLQNAGFLLSYGALAGILITGKYLTKIIMRVFPSYFSLSLSASCGAQIFTAPISLRLFGSFSPIGIIATVFVSPLITIFIYSGLIFIILCLVFPCLCSYSAIFLSLEYNLIKFFVGVFSKAPVLSLGE